MTGFEHLPTGGRGAAGYTAVGTAPGCAFGARVGGVGLAAAGTAFAIPAAAVIGICGFVGAGLGLLGWKAKEAQRT